MQCAVSVSCIVSGGYGTEGHRPSRKSTSGHLELLDLDVAFYKACVQVYIVSHENQIYSSFAK